MSIAALTKNLVAKSHDPLSRDIGFWVQDLGKVQN